MQKRLLASTKQWMHWSNTFLNVGWKNPCSTWSGFGPRRSNGCAYCLDMHWKDLRAIGEGEQRLYSLDAWRECPYYTDRERAALSWTEAVTLIANDHVPDAVYEEVRRFFSEKELSDLTLAVCAINAWNRLSISARIVPGGYHPANAAK